MNQNQMFKLSTIEEFLSDTKNSLFRIPSYQREYSWVKQIDVLLDDLNETEIDRNLFLGVIFCSKSEEELLIVDGQQRIITISILLSRIMVSIMNFIENDCNSTTVKDLDEINKRKDLIKNISKCIYQENENNEKIKLQVYNDSVLLNFVVKKEFNIKELQTSDRKNKLVVCAKKCEDYLKKLNENELYDFAQKLLQTKIISINLSDFGINQNELFEAFNSKNEPLKNFDLVTNSIFMRIKDEKKQVDIYKTHWENKFKETGLNIEIFLRDFISMKNLKVVGDKGYEIHREFNQLFKKMQFSNESEQISELKKLIIEMHKYFKIYKCIKTDNRISDEFPGSKINDDIICEYKFLKVESANSFFLYLINELLDENITQKHFDIVVKHINNYIYKKKIVGPTAQNRKIFIETLSSCKNSTKKGMRNWILSEFISVLKIHTDKNDSLKYTTNKSFVDKIKIEFNDFNDSKYLFVVINNNEKKATKIRTFSAFENATVEHIVPQSYKDNSDWVSFLEKNKITEKDFYLNGVQNLTILTAKENSYLSNKLFKIKILEIPKSEYKINHEFLNYKNIIDMRKKWANFIEERLNSITPDLKFD